MATPSFFEGMARVMDFGNTISRYNSCATGDEADYAANWSDWDMVSQDLMAAAKELRKQYARMGQPERRRYDGGKRTE